MKDANVPMTKVSTRLKISKSYLRRILNNDDDDYNPFVDRRARVPRFHKIHQRARELIDMIID